MTITAVRDFLARLESALTQDSFVKLSLKGYRGADKDIKSLDIVRIKVKREEKLSFTTHYKTKDIVKNYDPAPALTMIRDYLRRDFETARLFTVDADISFPDLKQAPPKFKEKPSLAHNREKNRHVDAAKPYLHALKITDEKGGVYKNAQDKFRQIDKYVEILSGLVKDIAPGNIRRIADMGSGKGYLTFALYDYLHSTLNIPAHVTGVEFRKDMVDLCNGIAASSGFSDLSFVQGTIENYDASGTNILIALHACDTATDDAIHKGIKAGAELIVVAPCCHKQIRREIENAKKQNDLGFLMKYGTFVEREAEMVTDGLRALILEYFGYTTKVFEFISDAHTPKNVMIVGVKNPKARMNDPKILQSLKDAKDYFGIGYHHLEKLSGL